MAQGNHVIIPLAVLLLARSFGWMSPARAADPTCSISGPSSGVRGETLCFTAAASDPDGDDIVSYEWDFDGGTRVAQGWWHTYDGDVHPLAAGWDRYEDKDETNVEEIVDIDAGNSALHVVDTTTDKSKFGKYPDVSAGVTVLGRFQYVRNSATTNCLVADIQTGAHRARFSWYGNALYVDQAGTGTDQYYGSVPANEWHIIRVIVNSDDEWSLHIDESPTPVGSGTGLANPDPARITIGCTATSKSGEMYVDWFYIADSGAWAPGEAGGPELPGAPQGSEICAKWDTLGVKNVCLTLTDDQGATGNCCTTVEIVNILPSCSITADPPLSVVGRDTTFDAYPTDVDGSVVDVAWDFGDGGTGSGNAATHVYTAPGYHSVTATVTDNDAGVGSCTLMVNVDEPPVCMISGPATGVAFEEICFGGSESHDPDGGALMFAWDFGDAPAALVVQDASFETGAGWTLYRGGPAPPNSFGPFCHIGLPARTDNYVFGNASNGGNVAASICQILPCAVSGRYYNAQVYIQTYGVYNPANIHCRIGVDPAGGTDPGAAAWADSYNQGCPPPWAPLSLIFQATTGTPTLFVEYYTDTWQEWNVAALDDVSVDGAPGTSSEESPCHTFDDPGAYTITLCVTDDEGTTSCCYHEIEIEPAPNQSPVCDFAWTPAEPTDLDTVQFTDQSTPPETDDAIAVWAWGFGDGGTSDVQNPTHQFTDDGTYHVCLTVTDSGRGGMYAPRSSCCCETVTVANAPPVCSFTGPTSGQVGSELCWTSTSTDPDGIVVAYWWDFDEPGPNLKPDGDFETGFYPPDSWPCPGKDSGELGNGWLPWADGQCGWMGDYLYFDSTAVICEGEHAQGLDFNTGSRGFYNEVSGLTPGGTYLLTGCIRYDHSSGNYWAEFGCSDADPPSPGGGCTSPDDPYPGDPWLFKQDAWGMGPPPGAWYTCGPYRVTPQGTSLIVWYRFGGNPGSGNGYGDGVTVTEVVSTPTGCHTYSTAGTHTVTLTVTDDDGGTGTCPVGVTVVTVPPTCSITYLPNTPVAGEPTIFDSHASDPDGGDVSVAWTFGDGTTGSGITTSHTYASSGIYTAACTVTDDDGETDTCQVTLSVVTAPPICSFSWTPSDPYEDQQVDFDGAASSDPDGSIISWVWEFGDGGSATGCTASHTYTAASTYTASLTVTDNEGDSTECSEPIVVRITADLDWNCQLRACWGAIDGAPNDRDEYLGVRPGATDDYDFNLDARKPGPPMGNYVYAWFNRPTWAQGAIMHDWRSALTQGTSKAWGTGMADTWNIKTNLDQGGSGVYDHCGWGFQLPLAAAIYLTWEFGVSETPPAPLPPDEYQFTLQYKGGINAKPDNTAPVGVTVPTVDQTWDMEATPHVVIPLWNKDFQPPNPGCTDLAAADTARFKIIVNHPSLCPLPVSCFSFAPTAPTTSDVVQFTDWSSGPAPQTITTREWDFGDGGTSTEQNPTHQYATPGIYTVGLTVTNDCIPPQGATSSALVTVAATGNDSDLEVTKFGPASAAPADPISYEIYYRNNGPGWAYGVVVQDMPDVNVWSLSPTSWYLGDLAPGQDGHLYNEGQVAWPLGDGTVLTNTVDISSDVFDPNLFNNSASWETVVATPVDPNCKLVSPEGVVSPGQTLAYTLHYENVGQGTAHFVYVTDTLVPLLDETTLVIGNGGTYDPVLRTVIWQIGTVPAHTGDRVSLEVNVRADAPAGAAIGNQATVHFPTAPSSTDTNIVVNYVLNQPPVADITLSPEVPTVLDVVTFNAHATDPDPDGFVASVAWDFDDGSTAPGEVVTHQFSDDGTYNVICTVTDDLGLSVSYTAVVTVSSVRPSCDITYAPGSPATADAITFNSGGTDPDGVIISVNWDFGDGDTAGGDPATHQYATPGTYTVTATVCDDDGSCMGCAAKVTVANQPPICDITRTGARECATLLTFNANASDPDGTVTSVAWDFGDGHTASGDPATHAYGAIGTYMVTCTVIDDGGLIGTCQTTVTITAKTVSFFLVGPSWHMISLPCEPIDPDPAAVLDELDPYGDPSLLSGNLHRFDSVAKAYRTWYNFAPGDFAGPMQVGEGYWLYVFQDVTITYAACCPYGERSINFPVAGWYMIGHPQFGDVDIRSDDMQAELGASGRIFYRDAVPDWIGDPLHGYDPAMLGYYQVTVGTGYVNHHLHPYEGYWAYVREAGLTTYVPAP